MSNQKTLSKNKELNNLEKISEKEIYSGIWSRVIIKESKPFNTYFYCKKEDLENSSPDVEWFYELSAEGNPKDNLDKYLSDNSFNHKYSNRDRRKIFHNREHFEEFELDGEKWLYYENKKPQIDVESLDGTYQESFVVEYAESFDSVPVFEKKTHKNDYKYICGLLEQKSGRSVILRSKNDRLVSRLDENNPPDLYIDKLSDSVKKLFLITILILSMFTGMIIFLIPIHFLSLLLSPFFFIMTILCYVLLGCKYMCLLGIAYPLEIVSRIGDYIYKDKYELKPIDY